MPYRDPEQRRLQRLRWAAANPEKVRSSARVASRKWRLLNPDRVTRPTPEKSRLYAKRYREKYPEKARAVSVRCAKAWRDANREEVRAKDRRRHKENPAKQIACNVRRRALKLAQTCNCCSSAGFAALYTFAVWVGGEVDHVTALALGGAHCLKNLQVLTPEQHLAKTRVDLGLIAELKRKQRKR